MAKYHTRRSHRRRHGTRKMRGGMGTPGAPGPSIGSYTKEFIKGPLQWLKNPENRRSLEERARNAQRESNRKRNERVRTMTNAYRGGK